MPNRARDGTRQVNVASSEEPTGRNKKVRALEVADRRGDRIYFFVVCFEILWCGFLLSVDLGNLPLMIIIVFAYLKFLCWSSLDQTVFKEQTTARNHSSHHVRHQRPEKVSRKISDFHSFIAAGPIESICGNLSPINHAGGIQAGYNQDEIGDTICAGGRLENLAGYNGIQ